MLFQLENAAKLEDILKIPIPYTEELDETEFEKFQKKVQKGKVNIPTEELEEHIAKYYKRKNGTDNMWMYKAFPDPKEHFLDKKLESLQEPPRQDQIFRDCFCILNDSLEQIYKQDFMNVLPLSNWEEFIKDFSSQMIDFIQTLDSSVPLVEKKRLAERRTFAAIGMFHFEYSFYNIHSIFKNKTMTDFQKIRAIRSFLTEWEFCNTLRQELKTFELEQWDYFFQLEDEYSFGRINFDRLMNMVTANRPLPFAPPELIQTNSNYYMFFGWKTISIRDLDNQIVPLSESIIQNYFHKDSHFENDIFWFLNVRPYIIYYDNKRANEESYKSHKENMNVENSILKCPVKYIPKHDMDCLHTFCMTNFKCQETWKFLQKAHSSISLEDLLRSCFNIIGRMSKKYDCSVYHYSLQEKMKRNLLNKKKLHKCNEKILFPELYFNQKNTRDAFAEVWKKSFQFFVSDFIDFFLNRKQTEVLYIEKIPNFIQPTLDLTCYIGTDDLYTVLEKKKTYLEYFNTKSLFVKHDNTDTSPKKYKNDMYIEKIDSYILNLLKKTVK